MPSTRWFSKHRLSYRLRLNAWFFSSEVGIGGAATVPRAVPPAPRLLRGPLLRLESASPPAAPRSPRAATVPRPLG